MLESSSRSIPLPSCCTKTTELLMKKSNPWVGWGYGYTWPVPSGFSPNNWNRLIGHLLTQNGTDPQLGPLFCSSNFGSIWNHSRPVPEQSCVNGSWFGQSVHGFEICTIRSLLAGPILEPFGTIPDRVPVTVLWKQELVWFGFEWLWCNSMMTWPKELRQ